MLDISSHLPLYIQLKDDLEGRIKGGVWSIDCQIPTETELMDTYHVGRATVREAVSMLVNEGYLSKKKGIGTFVARRQPSLGFEPLISLSYSLKARGMEPRNLITNQELITPTGQLCAKLKWNRKRKCFYVRRLRFADKQPVAVEESYFDGSYRDSLCEYDLTGSLVRIILEDLNISIKKIEQVIVPRVATAKEQTELKMDELTQVIDLERWIYADGSEEPFFYVNFVIPGNLYSYSSY
jgi:GntR family transcriptional regulator